MSGDEAWRWFRSIGSPQRVLAPMVGQSELAFRLLCRRYGAELCVTPMINAKSFLGCARHRREVFLDLEEARRSPSLDRPLLVQLCGDDPDVLLRAGEVVQDGCDGVDVNLGCPQGIAKRGHYGAFLLHEPERVVRIVRRLATGLRVPVTCKIRLVDAADVAPTLDLCRRVVDAGASMLTVHGRTREMKGHFVGAANWDFIGAVAAAVGHRVPVLANGGVERSPDVDRCLAATRANGVMVSEASLSDPTVFGNKTRTKIDLALEYLDIVRKNASAATHLSDVRSHLMKLLFELLQHPGNEGFRDAVVAASTLGEVEDVIRRIAVANRRRPIRPPAAASWYRRHRAHRHPDVGNHHPFGGGETTVNRFDFLDDDDDDDEAPPLGALFDDAE
ncbi:hypothetical protein CTAYLR_009786 [Chrysophaeum taylorii]|uniref:tRNA-dihydrouridine(16/17) synthase [NAD(P)(+)] n=1 Tax=Chrysophaeum taylorii TaxID=2483200 RepID=A0AAD7XPV5_9STRA|nr:hypothetical protein CTAYLR_009786 [Chrysophaeum taylorii]